MLIFQSNFFIIDFTRNIQSLPLPPTHKHSPLPPHTYMFMDILVNKPTHRTCKLTLAVGCHLTHLTSWVWLWRTLAHSNSSPSSSTSHTHTLLSRLQVARYAPDLDQSEHFTSFSWPSRVLLHWNSEGNTIASFKTLIMKLSSKRNNHNPR